MEVDWRVDSAKFLAGQPLQRKQWMAPSKEWDHDHCEACMVKFAEFDGQDILKEGYTTTASGPKGASYHWICVECFLQLKEQLKWYEVPSV